MNSVRFYFRPLQASGVFYWKNPLKVEKTTDKGIIAINFAKNVAKSCELTTSQPCSRAMAR